jgi:hypothetical protein
VPENTAANAAENSTLTEEGNRHIERQQITTADNKKMKRHTNRHTHIERLVHIYRHRFMERPQL